MSARDQSARDGAAAAGVYLPPAAPRRWLRGVLLHRLLRIGAVRRRRAVGLVDVAGPEQLGASWWEGDEGAAFGRLDIASRVHLAAALADEGDLVQMRFVLGGVCDVLGATTTAAGRPAAHHEREALNG